MSYMSARLLFYFHFFCFQEFSSKKYSVYSPESENVILCIAILLKAADYLQMRSNYLPAVSFRTCIDTHCMKSVQIRSFLWSVFSCIRTRKNSVFGHFSRSDNNIGKQRYSACNVLDYKQF